MAPMERGDHGISRMALKNRILGRLVPDLRTSVKCLTFRSGRDKSMKWWHPKSDSRPRERKVVARVKGSSALRC